MSLQHIRNFSIIAHIDHGKSTLSDRMLDVTHTIEDRKMQDQMLDTMELERERGITIKMQPVRMEYTPSSPQTHADHDAEDAESDTEDAKNPEFETENTELLYKDLTYQIRGACFEVRKQIGLGHKESVYHKALQLELEKRGLYYENEKNISITYDDTKVGSYQPDLIIEDKVLVELKALPEIGRPQEKQLWSYLKESKYRLGLLINFGTTDVDIKRVVYDTARDVQSVSASSASHQRQSAQIQDSYILNLIDTPGHIDFAYEVSRSLKAVEGAVVLVDATQGVQAQTLTTLEMAQEAGLHIIPALSKTDSPLARVEEVKEEVALLLDCDTEDIMETSGKTGAGVEALLERVVNEVPAPESTYADKNDMRALVFDFKYHPNKGIVVFVRVIDGELRKGQDMLFKAVGEKFNSLEVGIFSPQEVATDVLYPGEIGYITTGIKKPGVASVGDTIVRTANPLPEFGGYRTPRPVVWASIYSEDQDDFEHLKSGLSRLKLSDSSLSFDEETSGSLGRGFRCGFLGMLHLEIVTERLRREFNLALIITQPSIEYHITKTNGEVEIVYNPSLFPDAGVIAHISEPWVQIKIISPNDYAGVISQLLFHHEGQMSSSYTIGDGRIEVIGELPLRELMRGFFDELKSHTSGFASLSYEPLEYRDADVSRMDIIVADEVVPAFARVVSKSRAQEEAEQAVERLYEVMPRQNFVMKIQARAMGRILSSKTVKAFRKDVTAKLYGGDVTRKRKLLEKQKKGKSKMKDQGKVDIPQNVFMHMMKSK